MFIVYINITKYMLRPVGRIVEDLNYEIKSNGYECKIAFCSLKIIREVIKQRINWQK